ncbi:MAG: rod shape-determining protein MreD [Alphaproteobacteria bacterium]|nr:rod shape-determining protein MreD [Alphaproteobacteria bacterium]MBV8548207.1 rod shape-determining protein MreD [Alphaproteobacteria bacterium]
MTDGLWLWLDHKMRRAAPVVTVILSVIIGVLPWPLPYFGVVAPQLALTALYYWTLHRPDLFPASAAFAAGFLNDVLTGLPLGLSAFLYVGMRQVILVQRRFFAGHSFFMLWAGQALAVIGGMVMEWILLSLVRGQGGPFGLIALQILLTILVFPLPCWLMIWLQRMLLAVEV